MSNEITDFMPEQLAQYDAIIFDMDGTLIDSMPSHLDAWQKTAEQYGFPFDRPWHHSLGGVSTLRTAQLINQRYQLTLDPALVAKTKSQLWQELHRGPVLIDATYAIFNQCEGSKKLAVGTGAARAHAQEQLAMVGLLARLDALVTASDVEHGKPHPQTFLTAAALVGVVPQRCLVFEDTDIGRQAATAAGMDCVMVLDGQLHWPN